MVGTYDSSGDVGVVVPLANGAVGTAQTVPGTVQLQGVACASAVTCVAVGNPAPDGGLVVALSVSGPGAVTVGSAQAVATVGLYGVACPDVSSCDAVGVITSDVQPGVDDEGAVVALGLTGSGALTVVPEEPVAGTVEVFGVAAPLPARARPLVTPTPTAKEGLVASLPATQTISFTATASGVVGSSATLSATGGASGAHRSSPLTPPAGPGCAMCRGPAARR